MQKGKIDVSASGFSQETRPFPGSGFAPLSSSQQLDEMRRPQVKAVLAVFCTDFIRDPVDIAHPIRSYDIVKKGVLGA